MDKQATNIFFFSIEQQLQVTILCYISMSCRTRSTIYTYYSFTMYVLVYKNDYLIEFQLSDELCPCIISYYIWTRTFASCMKCVACYTKVLIQCIKCITICTKKKKKTYTVYLLSDMFFCPTHDVNGILYTPIWYHIR